MIVVHCSLVGLFSLFGALAIIALPAIHVLTSHEAARPNLPLPYERLPVVGEPVYRRPDEGERLAGTDRQTEQGAE